MSGKKAAANTIDFPIKLGVTGMNKLAEFLNASNLLGQWHFGAGTRFDQTSASIDFDRVEDMESAWRRYCDGSSGAT